MLDMSFYDGTFNEDEAIKFVNETNKEIKYTHGLGYRNPITDHEPITKEKACKLIKENSLINVREKENHIHINTFSSNDMY